MMLVNITNKFDPPFFQNSKAVVFDIKVQNNDDSLSLYFAVPRLRIEENADNIESSIASVRLN